MTFWRAWNEPCEHCSLPHLLLLWTFPSVWMGKNVINALSESGQQGVSIVMSVFDVCACAFKKITKIICEDLSNGLPVWKRWYIGYDTFCR